MAPPGWSPSSMRGTAARRSACPDGHVEAEGLFQEARRRVEKRPRHGAAHVVDDDVEPAELAVRRLGQRGHEVEVGQVARHDDGATPGGLDLLRHLAELVLGAGGQHDVGAGLGQRHRGGGPDAASAGGDDGDLVGDEELVEDHPANVAGAPSARPSAGRAVGQVDSGRSGAAGAVVPVPRHAVCRPPRPARPAPPIPVRPLGRERRAA